MANSTVRPCGQIKKCQLMSLMNCSFLVFIPRIELDPQVDRFQHAVHKFGTPAAVSQVNTCITPQVRACTPNTDKWPLPLLFFFPLKVIMWQLLKCGHGSNYL